MEAEAAKLEAKQGRSPKLTMHVVNYTYQQNEHMHVVETSKTRERSAKT